MTSEKKTDQLVKINVDQLFGRFSHSLYFGGDQDISIITAPNGYGKTAMLRIIDSFFKRKLNVFLSLDFEQIFFALESGRRIRISKQLSEDLIREEPPDNPQTLITTSGFGADGQYYDIDQEVRSVDISFLQRHLPVDRIGPNLWIDFNSQGRYTTDRIIEMYRDELPPSFDSSKKLPDWLLSATNSVDTHLVETQRLLYLEEQVSGRHGMRPHIRPPSVVEKDASDLSERIGTLLQRYANESQKLDQSFPKRVIESRNESARDEDEIRQDLEDLNEKRDDLVSVGLLGRTISEAIQPSDIFRDETIRKILEIYIVDTKSKLGIFDETYEKIRLFKQILDEHFSFKEIVIDSKDGIGAIDTDTEATIPLPELSSGEQHELVLIYELLFKVEEDSLILIDEPELSLHVAWQKRFIADLQKIQEIKKMKVLIATHSPQIINDRWDFVQELAAN
ncbi:MAG: AAA family ATPase [Gammaproteobacteria bacterium]|nr:AAA family ATPase [Gammaproteobacteria bacterium]